MPKVTDYLSFLIHLAEQLGLPKDVGEAITLATIVVGWLTLPIVVVRFVGRAAGAVEVASRNRVGSGRRAAVALVFACIELPLAVAGILKVCSVLAEWIRDSFPTGGTAPFVFVHYAQSLLRWTSDDQWIGTAVVVLVLLLAAFLLAQLGAPRAAKALELLIGYPLGWALEGTAYCAGIAVVIEVVMAFAHLDGASPQVIPLLLAITGLGALGFDALDPVVDGVPAALSGKRVR